MSRELIVLLLVLFVGVSRCYSFASSNPNPKTSKPLSSSSWQEHDVVIFEQSSTRLPQLGVVLRDRSSLHPLALRGEQEKAETEQDVLFGLVDDDDDDSASIPLANVQVLGVLDEVLLSQRAVEDRVHTPHGEHSEDVFVIRRNALPRKILVFYRLAVEEEDKDGE